MVKYIAVIVFSFLNLTCISQTDLVSYNFDYCSTAPYFVFPGFNATPVTTTAPLGTGCSLGCATGCGVSPDCLVNTSFITKSWNSVSVNFTKYYEFTISSAPDVSFYLNQFIFSYRRSSTGPVSFSLYVNGIQKGLGSISGTGCNGYGIGINQLYTGSTTFRLYFWGGTLDGTVRVDNFRITHSFTTLPVEFVYFEGRANDYGVDLEWMTASETDNSHYEVEKSLDGSQFVNIATVSAVGNSQQLTTYHYVDYTQGNAATLYYRLKQVDNDGQFSYSSIAAVNGRPDDVINNNGMLSLCQNKHYNKANVYDITGKLIHNLTFGSVKLKSGVYIVEVSREGFSSLQTTYIGQE